MTLLDHLLKINPQFLEFTVQQLKDKTNQLVGYQCMGVQKDGVVFSGGTAEYLGDAQRIAIAEAFERSFLDVIMAQPDLISEFKMREFPSSSGFAAGFDKNSTRFRALCEALERWAWSKWIDEKYSLEAVNILTTSLNPLAQHMLSYFDETLWFKKSFELPVSYVEKLNLELVVFLGIKDKGIFPGSRVSTIKDDLYTHPIIEAQRNLINYNLHLNAPTTFDDVIHERLVHFGNNKALALSQIPKFSNLKWPTPELDLLKEFNTSSNDEVFLFRALLKDFNGWHLGDVNRFVY